jgi:hypothetical protein
MAGLLLANPRSRKRRKAAPKRRRRLASTSTVRVSKRRTYKRNPSLRGGSLVTQVKNAAIGASGALAVDFAMQRMPFIPANFTQGPMGAATKGAVSVALGMIIGKVLKKPALGAQLAAGGMTVAAYEGIKGAVGPSIGLSGMPYNTGGLLGEYFPTGGGAMGEYFEDEGMGYMNPAEVFEM